MLLEVDHFGTISLHGHPMPVKLVPLWIPGLEHLSERLEAHLLFGRKLSATLIRENLVFS